MILEISAPIMILIAFLGFALFCAAVALLVFSIRLIHVEKRKKRLGLKDHEDEVDLLINQMKEDAKNK